MSVSEIAWFINAKYQYGPKSIWYFWGVYIVREEACCSIIIRTLECPNKIGRFPPISWQPRWKCDELFRTHLVSLRPGDDATSCSESHCVFLHLMPHVLASLHYVANVTSTMTILCQEHRSHFLLLLPGIYWISVFCQCSCASLSVYIGKGSIDIWSHCCDVGVISLPSMSAYSCM